MRLWPKTAPNNAWGQFARARSQWATITATNKLRSNDNENEHWITSNNQRPPTTQQKHGYKHAQQVTGREHKTAQEWPSWISGARWTKERLWSTKTFSKQLIHSSQLNFTNKRTANKHEHRIRSQNKQPRLCKDAMKNKREAKTDKQRTEKVIATRWQWGSWHRKQQITIKHEVLDCDGFIGNVVPRDVPCWIVVPQFAVRSRNSVVFTVWPLFVFATWFGSRVFSAFDRTLFFIVCCCSSRTTLLVLIPFCHSCS